MMGGQGYFLGGFLGFIFWAVVICLGIGLLIHLFSNRDNSVTEEEDGDTALSILKKRYAKGEITSREFEKMKKDIS